MSMKLLWQRKQRKHLPTGEALYEEAERLGVTLHGLTYNLERGLSGEGGRNPRNEPEVQERVLAARNDRRNAILNLAQTLALIGALVVSVFVSLDNRRAQESNQRVQEADLRAQEGNLRFQESNLREQENVLLAQKSQMSADFMLRFSDELNKEGSARVSAALDEKTGLSHDRNVSDDDIDDFLSNYEMLDVVYRNNVIDRDMADAFSHDLERALNDKRVIQYLRDSRSQKSDLFDGVRDLARAWKIPFPQQQSKLLPLLPQTNIAPSPQ
jgi:hypothetical protein